MTTDLEWADRFPDLFTEHDVAYAGVRVALTTSPPADELINRLHLVASVPDGRIVVCRSAQEWRFLPGGTREPSEALVDLAARELLEEAGAELLDSPQIFASFRVESSRPEPYRPHLAHPRAAWAFARCQVRLTGQPTNPPDGEDVVEVTAMLPDEAVSWLAVHDRTHAEIVALAIAMGLLDEVDGSIVESPLTRTSSR